MDAKSREHKPRWSAPLLWLIVLAAPLAWFVQLTAGYGLVELACRRQTMVPLFVATAVCAFVAILGGAESFPLCRGRVPAPDIVDATSDHSQSFFGEIGVGFALLFLLLMAGQTLAVAFLMPCP
jgi:hypothetical protein